MPAHEMIRRLPTTQLGGARVFRAFSQYKRGDMLSSDDLAKMGRANLRALMDQGFIIAWPKEEGIPAATLRPGEVYVVQRMGSSRFDVYLGEKLNGAPLSKAEAEALAERHQPATPPAKSAAA